MPVVITACGNTSITILNIKVILQTMSYIASTKSVELLYKYIVSRNLHWKRIIVRKTRRNNLINGKKYQVYNFERPAPVSSSSKDSPSEDQIKIVKSR